MITIATFNNPIEANLAQQLLEDQGISSFLKDESTVNIAWHLTVAVGGIKLQVSEEIAELAREILQEYQDSLPQEETEIIDDFTIQEKINLSFTNQRLNQSLKVAIIGLLFPPLQLYSLWILFGLIRTKVKLTLRQKLKLIMIFGIDLTVIIVILHLIF
jgi:hypothetical protein